MTKLEIYDWEAATFGKEFEEKDLVSDKIDLWTSVLQRFRRENIRILEIGSMEGRSAIFFGTFFPNSQITCIDPFYGNRMERFIKNTEDISSKISVIRDYSLPALTYVRQTNDSFDIIYIDGNHERETVIIDSALCWGMLKLGGVLMWDDYQGYKTTAENWERPTRAIDGFLVAMQGEFEMVHQGNQLIVRKIVDPPRGRVRLSRARHKPVPSARATADSRKSEPFIATRSLRNVIRLFQGRPLLRP